MKKIFAGLILCTVCVFGAYAETCLKRSLNVRYTCNGGTLVGELPPDTTATYGAVFYPTAITYGTCTPPDGYVGAGGLSYKVGDRVVAEAYGTTSFPYYFTEDMEIGPLWVRSAFNVQKFSQEHVSYSHGVTASKMYQEDGASGTWSIDTRFGRVSGISYKSNYVEVGTKGYIPRDQDLITADGNACPNSAYSCGCYCAINLGEPDPLWIFYTTGLNSTTSNCAANCANNWDKIMLVHSRAMDVKDRGL